MTKYQDMTFIYSISADSSITYYSMLYVSVLSVRKFYGTHTSIVIATDNEYEFRSKAMHRFDWINGINIREVDCPLTDPMERSRYLKIWCFGLVETRFCYVDCDTVMFRRLPTTAISSSSIIVGKDRVRYMTYTNGIPDYLVDSMSSFGEDWSWEAYYNSGVVIIPPTGIGLRFKEAWLDKWHQWRASISYHDQIAFNFVLRSNDVKYTDDLSRVHGIIGYNQKYIHISSICHFFSSQDSSLIRTYKKLCEEMFKNDDRDIDLLMTRIRKATKCPPCLDHIYLLLHLTWHAYRTTVTRS